MPRSLRPSLFLIALLSLTITPSMLRADRMARPALSREARVIADIQEAARIKVCEAGSPNGRAPGRPALSALQQQGVALKQETARALRIKATFARERGDLVAARQADEIIERHAPPPRPALHLVVRQLPTITRCWKRTISSASPDEASTTAASAPRI